MNLNLNELIPFFRDSDNKLNEEFNRHSIHQKFTAGTFLSMEGDRCSFFPIIKSGIVRVYKIGSAGQEMTLYRINPGESCVLTISCLLSNKLFPAVAFVEKDCEVILVPSNVIAEWISKYPIWNSYIFDYLSNVLMKVIGLVEDITFKRVDVRIAEYLIKHFIAKGKNLTVTQQQIAGDIGTAREVVNRILKDFENQELVILKRGKIIINNFASLQKKLKYIQ